MLNFQDELELACFHMNNNAGLSEELLNESARDAVMHIENAIRLLDAEEEAKECSGNCEKCVGCGCRDCSMDCKDCQFDVMSKCLSETKQLCTKKAQKEASNEKKETDS